MGNNNNSGNYLSGEKKSGKNTGREKESRGKISYGKNLVTSKKFSHFFPNLFPSIRYTRENEHKFRVCVYCDKEGHKSSKCKTVAKVSERRLILSQKRLSF